MCIYRDNELFMTSWWPGTVEKKIYRDNKSNCFHLTKRNNNLLACLYKFNPSLAEKDTPILVSNKSRKKFYNTLFQLGIYSSSVR